MRKIQALFLIDNLKLHILSCNIGIIDTYHLIFIILLFIFHFCVHIIGTENEVFDSVDFKVSHFDKFFLGTWREALRHHFFVDLDADLVDLGTGFLKTLGEVVVLLLYLDADGFHDTLLLFITKLQG